MEKLVEVTDGACEVEGGEVGESMLEAREERVCLFADSESESETISD